MAKEIAHAKWASMTNGYKDNQTQVLSHTTQEKSHKGNARIRLLNIHDLPVHNNTVLNCKTFMIHRYIIALCAWLLDIHDSPVHNNTVVKC